MSTPELKKLEERIKLLENNKQIKKPRIKSDYNIFVQNYISEEKKKENPKTHKELFSDAAKEWSKNKK